MNNFINYLPSLWFDKNNLLLIDNWKELINILDSKSKKLSVLMVITLSLGIK